MLSVEELRRMLDKCGVAVSMVCIDVQTDPKWRLGSVTSRDLDLRRVAIQTVKEAMDVAAELGAMKVNFWPGQDGNDYPFQSDYLTSWARITEALREISEHNRDVRICVEYKAKEPRTHSFIGTIGKALALIEDVGAENIGITLDVGHSLMAHENVAESIALASSRGRLFHLHLNDNYRDWDHDMIAGSIHFWEYLELLLWLKITGYDGWYSLDIFPYREDPIQACQESLENIKLLMRVVESVGVRDLIGAVRKGKFRDAYAMIREALGQLGS